MSFSRFLRRWIPPVIYIGVIYRLSLEPTTPVPLPHGVDKVAHGIEYAVLGLLLARTDPSAGLRSRLGFALIGLAVGAVDEWIQSHVPGRESTIADFLADGTGIALGLTLGPWFWGRRWLSRLVG